MAKTSTKTPAEQEAAAKAKAEKFKELAVKRLANAQKAIGLIGNLASYKPNQAQQDYVMGQLAESCKGVMARFQGGKSVSNIVIPD